MDHSLLGVTAVVAIVMIQPVAASGRKAPSSIPTNSIQEGTTMRVTDLNGLPDQLKTQDPLWEVDWMARVPDDMRHASRLYANGDLYEYSRDEVIFHGGKVERKRTSTAAWRLSAKINADGINQVKKAIPEFEKLVSDPQMNSKTCNDCAPILYISSVDERRHEYTALTGATEKLPSILRDIQDTIARHIVPRSQWPREEDSGK